MNKINKFLTVAVLITLVIAVGGYYFPQIDSVLGAVGTRFPHGVTIGNTTYSASNLSLVKVGTCSLVSDNSIAATSTGTGTCATTGSLAGDVVIVSLATTTTKVAAQYVVTGTVATTDSTTVRLVNLTGGAAVPSATNGLGSSTQYQVFRSQ